VFVRLWPAASVYGRVTDESGQPVAGAEVVGTKDYTWLDGGFLPPETRTDDDGRFRLNGIPIGKFAVRVRAAGFAIREHEGENFSKAKVNLQLSRDPGVIISIRTTGLPPAIDPPPTVRIDPMRNGGGFTMPSSLDALPLRKDGTLVIKGLPVADEWTVSVSAPGWTFDPIRHRLREPNSKNEVSFKAVEDGSIVVRGVLRTKDGTPLAGETLEARRSGGRRARANTDKDGRFEIAGPLAPGDRFRLLLLGSNYVLRQNKTQQHAGWHDKRYLVTHEAVAAEKLDLQLEATPGAFVSGRLVDTDGRPVPFQYIRMQALRPANWSPRWGNVAYATSRRDGSFAFPGVHGSDEKLRLYTTGRLGAGSKQFRLQHGQRLDNLELRIAKAGVVEGILADSNGTPAAGIVVTIRNYDLETGKSTDGSWTNVLTDWRGRFRFIGVAPGGHRVAIARRWSPGQPSMSDIFGVKPGGVTKINLTWPDK